MRGTGFYHAFSRVVDAQFIFGEAEKRHLRHTMRGLETLTGVRVLTYCLMSNHFHVLLRVPDADELAPAEEVSDEQLVRLMRPLYGAQAARDLARELRSCGEHGLDARREEIRDGFLRRRGRLDEFMKGLKQRFTQWYNRREGRTGRGDHLLSHRLLPECLPLRPHVPDCPEQVSC